MMTALIREQAPSDLKLKLLAGPPALGMVNMVLLKSGYRITQSLSLIPYIPKRFAYNMDPQVEAQKQCPTLSVDYC